MKTIDELGNFIHLMPGPIYIKSANSVYLYLNQFALDASGFASYEDIIGKNDHELWPGDYADQIMRHDQEVVRTKKPVIGKEETVLQKSGKVIYFSVIKIPLFDDDGNLLGIIGNSTDITARKQKEILTIENERFKVASKEQQKFRKVVGQVMHDIQSPLSSLQTIVKGAQELPEPKRIALRNIAMSIGDITNHLLNQYKPDSSNNLSENNRPQPVLVSLALSEIISDRRHKFKDLPIKFEYEFSNLCSFAFIKVEPSNFRRMIINLINNSVDSMPKKGGTVRLEFIAHPDNVLISVIDNGKGIPFNALQKIKAGVSITQGKKDGHGIGLTVVHETLKSNHGEFQIFSRVGKNHGTDIILTFPRAGASSWIAQEISLTRDDTVIILDDDDSIHDAWESRFSYILEKVPSISLKHFTQGSRALEFIDKIPESERHKVCLLSDYELIKQGLNGLQVIEKAKIKRSTLVTSHYADTDIQKLAHKYLVKILPKELAYEVPLKITQKKRKGELSQVHMVFVDDDRFFTENLISSYYGHLVIDTYTNPFEFLDNVDHYPLDTKIIIDNNFYYDDGSYIMNGLNIAKQLHDKGFSKLFMVSGERVLTPDYLISILKNDEETLAKLDKL